MKPTMVRSIPLLILGFISLALVSAPFSRLSQAAPKGQDVIVVNSPSEPVPTISQGIVNVTGTVSVAGTPTVTLAGTPTVNLAAGAGVAVTNTPLSPVLTRDVDRVGQTPVDVGFSFVAPQFATYQVPAGERLTIRSASGFCNTMSVNPSVFVIETSVGGNSVKHFLPNTASDTSPMLAAQFLAFADGGTQVSFYPGNGPWTSCTLSFAGYLQPM